MKKNNKSWIRQLSESYIRQTLNEESDLHQVIDDEHSRLVPEHKGQVKAHLDAIVAKTGQPLSHEDAIGHVIDRFVDGNMEWQNAVADRRGGVGDYSGYGTEARYMRDLMNNTSLG
jgi:hypothetical protein